MNQFWSIAKEEKILYCLTMLTKNDLSAIRKTVKGEVHGVEERLGKRIDGVEQRLSDKIAKVEESLDIVEEVVVKHYHKMEQRITDIEEDLHSSGN